MMSDGMEMDLGECLFKPTRVGGRIRDSCEFITALRVLGVAVAGDSSSAAQVKVSFIVGDGPRDEFEPPGARNPPSHPLVVSARNL